MMSQLPDILALDFDGVICNGLVEYFASTKRAYQQIWTEEQIDDRLAPSFYRLRPVIETGWEMPILLRALISGVAEADILSDWQKIARQITESEGLEKQAVAQQLDGVRDSWIKNDLDGWLELHRFYPGIIERLEQIVNSVELYIVTTKEGRFVQKLLQQQGIDLPVANIIGKESKRPKYETLRILKNQYSSSEDLTIFFVEDRLKALQHVARQNDLPVRLFLADWGYNLESDRAFATQDRQIQLLSLEQFKQDFANW
ncbi:HAD hydrolase-like protein [Pleurocapsales cyanobacterium LEGE 10410]|nr:HAD hydrolase-like protein [Pleurocapsales cyanobacterium LEGE 10410]